MYFEVKTSRCYESDWNAQRKEKILLLPLPILLQDDAIEKKGMDSHFTILSNRTENALLQRMARETLLK